MYTASKKQYARPTVKEYGVVRELTQASSGSKGKGKGRGMSKGMSM